MTCHLHSSCGVHLQIINILTLGSPDGIGCFFPKGFLGKINKPTGYDASASGQLHDTPVALPRLPSRWGHLYTDHPPF